MWPFNKPETRADTYTELRIAALEASARGEVVTGLSAGVEVCAGAWGRAFASAEVIPDGVLRAALTPHLSTIGRSMILKGEVLFEVDVERGLSLLPVASSTITGGPHPDSWEYLVTLSGPSETRTRTLPASRVLHLRYAVDPAYPWRGLSPLIQGGTTRRLLDTLETRLSEEIGGPVGSVIPIPDTTASGPMQAEIKALRGGVGLVDSVTSAKWGSGPAGKNLTEYPVRRIGGNPPESLPTLRRQIEESVLAACGVPLSLISGGQATAAREGFRQFLHAVVQPVARQVAGQIAERFETPVRFDFQRLGAADISGRSRAVGTFVQAGMPLQDALATAMVDGRLTLSPRPNGRHG